MIKKHKWLAILSSVVILLPALFGVIIWNQLPENMGDDLASDLPQTVHTLTDEALCQQVRLWLSQQNIPQLYPDGPREAYDLTADQVKALVQEFPLLALPAEILQLELKSAE